MRSRHHSRHSDAQEIKHGGQDEVPSPFDTLTLTQGTLTPKTPIRKIGLNQLTLAPGSRRKMSRRAIQLLAGRIHTSGRLQSLMVIPREGSQYYVVAGDRRFAALRLLVEDKRISPTFPVPCRVIERKSTTEPNAVTNPILNDSCPEIGERRRRFLALRERCPGLLTASELAARRCFRGVKMIRARTSQI